MEIRTLEEVEKEIAETKKALADVHGTETEVYARIVGYYRAVKHWNKGKRDEFDLRKMFTEPTSSQYEITEADFACAFGDDPVEKVAASSGNGKFVKYEIYTRKTCPNCPPVKAFMLNVEITGNEIDVDTEEGLSEAGKKGVFATPTVILFDENGVETARCHNIEELEAVFNTVEVVA